MIDKNESCNLSNSFPYKIYSCDCLICCSKCCRHWKRKTRFFFSNRREEKQGETGEASAAASQS